MRRKLQFIVKCSMQEYESLILEKNINIKCEDVVNSLAKLYDHIALEEERLINNDKTVRESGEKLQNDLVYNFNAMANSITQKFNDMSNAQNANIMTIVGLFSAIIFVFFGGVTGLSSVIKGIFELSKKEDLAIPLIIIMFIGLMLFDIVFMLLYSIAKILNRDIGRMVFDGSYHCYWYEQNGDFFHVKDECNKIVSCTNEECKAQKICKRKNRIPKCRSKMKTVINAIILRYPMVFLFNLFGIGLISYLLTKV